MNNNSLFLTRRVGKYGAGISSDQMFPPEPESTADLPAENAPSNLKRRVSLLPSRIRTISVLSRVSKDDTAIIASATSSRAPVHHQNGEHNSSPYRYGAEASCSTVDSNSIYSSASPSEHSSTPTSHSVSRSQSFIRSTMTLDSTSSRPVGRMVGRGGAGAKKRSVAVQGESTSSVASNINSPPITPLSPSFPTSPRSATFQPHTPNSATFPSRHSMSSLPPPPPEVKVVRMSGRGGAGAKPRAMKAAKPKPVKDVNASPLATIRWRTPSFSRKSKRSKNGIEHLAVPLSAPPTSLPSPQSAWPTTEESSNDIPPVPPLYIRRRSLGSIAETNSVVSAIHFPPARFSGVDQATMMIRRRSQSAENARSPYDNPDMHNHRSTLPTPNSSAVSLPETREYDGDEDDEHVISQRAQQPRPNKFMRMLGESDLSTPTGSYGIRRPTLEPLHVQTEDFFSHVDAMNHKRGSISSSMRAAEPLVDDAYDPSLLFAEEGTSASEEESEEAEYYDDPRRMSSTPTSVIRDRFSPMEFSPPTPPRSPLRTNNPGAAVIGSSTSSHVPAFARSGPAAPPFSFYSPTIDEEDSTEDEDRVAERIYFAPSSSLRHGADRPIVDLDIGPGSQNPQNWAGSWNRVEMTDVIQGLRMLK